LEAIVNSRSAVRRVLSRRSGPVGGVSKPIGGGFTRGSGVARGVISESIGGRVVGGGEAGVAAGS